jgi:hypothetical protein
MITGILSIREMIMDEFGLKPIDIDPENLRMSTKIWKKQRLVPIGKMIEQTSFMELIFQTMKKQSP